MLALCRASGPLLRVPCRALLPSAAPCWPALGRVAGLAAQALVAEVDRALAGGGRIDKGGSTYSKLDTELVRLRDENDKVTAQVDELKKVRSARVVEEDELIARMRLDGDVNAHGPSFVEALKKIEEVDSQLAGLRYQQLQNSKDIADLKRGKVRIENTEEVAELVKRVEDALERGLDVGGLHGDISSLAQRFLDDFDATSHAVQATKKELENTVGRLRNLELGLRVRRGRIDAEVDTLRGQLVSSFYEAQRKNSRLTRLRDMQALYAKQIGLLERTLDKVTRRARVQELLAGRDQEKMGGEASALWEEIEQMQKAIQHLEEVRDRHSHEASAAVTLLRAPHMRGTVNAESGALRERLIAALREEELCADRLARLRNTQALDIQFLQEVKGAIVR